MGYIETVSFSVRELSSLRLLYFLEPLSLMDVGGQVYSGKFLRNDKCYVELQRVGIV